jgi:hypothetical protein
MKLGQGETRRTKIHREIGVTPICCQELGEEALTLSIVAIDMGARIGATLDDEDIEWLIQQLQCFKERGWVSRPNEEVAQKDGE